MTTESVNLNLTLYDNDGDQSGSFITWVQDMSGSSNSNMTKIDDYAGNMSGSLTGISTSVSGSMVNISGSMASISGSLVTLTASLAELQLRLQKIDEFSDAGQADFDDIPQTFTHLVIMGVVNVNLVYNSNGFGCDFNGDANSAHYNNVTWIRYNTPPTESFSEDLTGELFLGSAPGNTNLQYGTPVLAIIPNYSASGGFYKTGMSFTTYHLGGTYIVSSTQGGVWKSTAAINRIRIFGLWAGSTRYDFSEGTKLSLYGFG